MADRFPLIVNSVSQKIEELVSGDNLDLTGNNIVISGDTGSGKYLTSNGSVVSWGTPGDVYLTASQTLTNKTFDSCVLSGSNNTISNIPNTALVNSGITVNGSTIALGGTVTTPDNNTTYSVSTIDGSSPARKILRLTSGGNAGAGIDDDITLVAGTNMTISRSGEELTFASSYVDTDTITTLQSATGGVAQSGAMTIAAGGSSTVSQDAATRTITISSTYVDTITRLRATTGQVFAASDFTFLDGGATTVAQGVDGNGDPTITYSSVNTVTRAKGGAAGSFVSGDVEFTGGSNVTVSQAGSTISIASVDTDTVTRLSTGANALGAGDFTFVGSGATNVSQNTVGSLTTITVTSANDDTGASLTASSGIILSSNDFRLKNAGTFSGNTVLKWDSGNSQFTDGILTDNGSTVTVNGDLVVEGTQTILNTTTLQIEDNNIELRKGNNLVGTNGGITLNRTSDSSGNVTSYVQLQWNEGVGYWRSWDGSVEKRFVTEGESQVLTNKTLTSPVLTAPILGSATATSINGLIIASTASGELDIATGKKLDIDRDLLLTSDNNTASISINFRQGGNVAYTSDTLATFASTTSTQMRGLITDTTGTNRLVFQDSPTILTSLNTTSAGFTLLNATVTNVTAFGAASIITMGQTGGTTTINQNLQVNEDLTVGSTISDNITLNGTVNSENADILIRGTSSDPMRVGRGNSAVNTNTAVGVQTLNSVTSGSQNTGYGYQALFTTNSGAANTAVGNRALRANGIGSNNIAIGRDSMLVSLDGTKNVAIGNNTLESNSGGDANVCVGHYAGFDVLGNGNVLIGPADNENSGDVTFRPPNISGDRQLVIGSGGQAWIRGDANYDITIDEDLTVSKDVLVKGNLTVQGVETIVKSNIVQITDKNIELAAVVSTQFVATVTTGTPNITGITPTSGLIPGMTVTTSTGGITIPGSTTIVSITNNTAVLSNNVTGNGQATITAIGPSDGAAEDGGIIVKGSTDKSIKWKGTDSGVTYNTWVSSENFDLAANKKLTLDGICVADPVGRTIGPVNGGGTDDINLSGGGTPYVLGSAVTGSSLTSLGTIQNLQVSSDNSASTVANIENTNTTSGFGVKIKGGGTTADRYALRVDNAAGDEVFRVNANKTIGINHATPTNTLQIGNTGHSAYGFAMNSPTYGAVIQVGDGADPTTAAALWVRNLRDGGTARTILRANGNGTVIAGNSSTYDGGGAAPNLYVRGTGGRQLKVHNPNAGTSSIQITNASTGQGEDAGPQIFCQGGTGMLGFNNKSNIGDNDAAYEYYADNASGTSKMIEHARAWGYHSFLSTGSLLNLNTSQDGTGNDYFARGSKNSTVPGGGNDVFWIYEDGDMTNVNGTFTVNSDIKLKENIVDAPSQWDDIKSLKVRKYNFKESTGLETHTQIGMIAQEVESVSPGLVKDRVDYQKTTDENGNVIETDTGETIKTVKLTVVYMKALKALQEAMTKIESLEARVTELEG